MGLNLKKLDKQVDDFIKGATAETYNEIFKHMEPNTKGLPYGGTREHNFEFRNDGEGLRIIAADPYGRVVVPITGEDMLAIGGYFSTSEQFKMVHEALSIQRKRAEDLLADRNEHRDTIKLLSKETASLKAECERLRGELDKAEKEAEKAVNVLVDIGERLLNSGLVKIDKRESLFRQPPSTKQ